MDETDPMGYNFSYSIELSVPAKQEPYSLSCRAGWAYRCRIPSKERYDMNKYSLTDEI